MEKLLLTLIVGCMLSMTSCGEDLVTQTGLLKRDCTGSYLHFEDKDHKICNPESVDQIQDNETISVSLKHLDTCVEAFPCQLLHVFEGWIEIKEVQ